MEIGSVERASNRLREGKERLEVALGRHLENGAIIGRQRAPSLGGTVEQAIIPLDEGALRVNPVGASELARTVKLPAGVIWKTVPRPAVTPVGVVP